MEEPKQASMIHNRYLVISDVTLTALSAILGFAIRLDIPLFWIYLPVSIPFALAAIAGKFPLYFLFGLYRRRWRYIGLYEAWVIFSAVTVSSATLALLVLGVFLPQGWFSAFPRSALVIDWLWSLFFIGGVRFSVRFLGEFGTPGGERAHHLYARHGKRLFDLAVTLPLLILLSPVLAVVALLVRIKLGSPILFRQQRPGLHGRPFTIYKFRTMTDARDAQGNLLPDERRLTSWGRFLRSTSLDELPELFNVLKGDMSLVGPRPLLMQYLERYTPEQMRRHQVRPGVTGWAQINGRNVLSWEQKFALDVWYVEHWSLWLDIKIVPLTFWKIIKREGISQPGQATAEEFMEGVS